MTLGLSYGRALQEYWNQGARDSSEYINFANNGFRDTSYVLVDGGYAYHHLTA